MKAVKNLSWAELNIKTVAVVADQISCVFSILYTFRVSLATVVLVKAFVFANNADSAVKSMWNGKVKDDLSLSINCKGYVTASTVLESGQ